MNRQAAELRITPSSNGSGQSCKGQIMSAIEMSISGYALIGTGIVFFIVTQVLLNRWVKAYNAEQRGDGYDR